MDRQVRDSQEGLSQRPPPRLGGLSASSPASAANSLDQARGLLGLSTFGEWPAPSTSAIRAPGTPGRRPGARRIVDLVLGAEDRHQRHGQRAHALVERLGVAVVLLGVGRVGVGREGHRAGCRRRPDRGREAGLVVARREGLLVALLDRATPGLSPPQRLADHRRRGQLREEGEVAVARVGRLVDDHHPVDELACLLGERDGDRAAERVADDDRALDAEAVERAGDEPPPGRRSSSRSSASPSRRGRAGRCGSRGGRWASSGSIPSHQCSEQPKQWMSTIGSAGRRPPMRRSARVGHLDVAAGQA